MTYIHSFAPVSTAAARLLIIGSMPGRRSLELQQYYAYPQNAFWKIMGELLGFDATIPYHDRLGRLNEAGVALWDVLAACRRESSLDSDIVEDSIVVNDFYAFFDAHPGIRKIYCNGAKAAASYQRYVLPTLEARAAAIPLQRLPSTSPAHAALGFSAKLEAWSVITDHD